MTKKEIQKRVLQHGKQLPLSKFNWDEKTNTFSSNEPDLILNFHNIHHCTFNTTYNCTFNTGSNCTFKTDSNCTFKTGSNCIFKTGYNCTFKTISNCIFDTLSYCTFDTSTNCIFNTGSNCIFKTDFHCTFKTISNCVFNTGADCTFDTSTDCIFNTGANCTFNTDFHCTFYTGFNCIFDTGSYCIFKTDSNCTFNTGPNCTFDTLSNSVIIRRDKFQVIQPKENEIIKLCPYDIPGYISKRDGEDSFHMDTANGREEHIIADNILSKVISKRKNVYKVINHNETKETYLIEVDGKFSHGETLTQAKESLIYKLSDRDTSKYEAMTVDTELSFEEGVQMYMSITGACEKGTKYFVDNVLKTKKKKYKISEIIDLTVGQYEHRKIVEFFYNTIDTLH